MPSEKLNNLVENIANFILKDEKAIIENIEPESIVVYEYLQSECQKGNVNTNYFFQFVFRSFYRLDNAGLTTEFKNEYFNVFEYLRKDKAFQLAPIECRIKMVDDRLKEFKNRKGQLSIQFSFITKMLNILDDSQPIFDSQVANIFNFSETSYSQNRDERITAFTFQLNQICAVYKDILEKNKLQSTIELFKIKFPTANISEIKILDFIFWQAGKQKPKL